MGWSIVFAVYVCFILLCLLIQRLTLTNCGYVHVLGDPTREVTELITFFSSFGREGGGGRGGGRWGRVGRWGGGVINAVVK